MYHINGVEIELYSGPDGFTSSELEDIWKSLKRYIDSSGGGGVWTKELAEDSNKNWEFLGKEIIRDGPRSTKEFYVGIVYKRGAARITIYQNQIAIDLVAIEECVKKSRTLFMKKGERAYEVQDDLSDSSKFIRGIKGTG
jgi:hypothetical protein